MLFDILATDDIYHQRRQAAAELWHSVSAEQFNLSIWKRSTPCGTIGCALGWLAEKRHDNWNFSAMDGGIAPHWEIDHVWNNSFDCAAVYFGITYDESSMCFSGDTKISYGVNGNEVTPAMVAAKLLSLPVTLAYTMETFHAV